VYLIVCLSSLGYSSHISAFGLKSCLVSFRSRLTSRTPHTHTPSPLPTTRFRTARSAIYCPALLFCHICLTLQALSLGLRKNTSLKELRLSGCRLTADFAEAVLEHKVLYWFPPGRRPVLTDVVHSKYQYPMSTPEQRTRTLCLQCGSPSHLYYKQLLHSPFCAARRHVTVFVHCITAVRSYCSTTNSGN
jgi:hypothetical protein